MHHHEQTISAKYGQEIFCMKESYLLGEGFGGNILYGRIIPFGEGFGLGLVRKKKGYFCSGLLTGIPFSFWVSAQRNDFRKKLGI
jgi:hypothetical protein